MPFQPAFAVFVLFVSSHALGWVSQLVGRSAQTHCQSALVACVQYLLHTYNLSLS